MYACLSCGFVHEGEVTQKRYDTDGGGSHYPQKPFHGIIIERICPKCNAANMVKMKSD